MLSASHVVRLAAWDARAFRILLNDGSEIEYQITHVDMDDKVSVFRHVST